MKKFFFFFFLLFLISSVLADEVDTNPGADINPFGEEETPVKCISFISCASLGYTCGTIDDGCGSTLNCGSCGSGETCSSGTCVTEGAGVVSPGAGGAIISSAKNLSISPKEFDIQMSINTNILKELKITNIGNTAQTVDISQSGLDNKIIFGNTSLTLKAGETKTLPITFVAPGTPGIYNGTILIKGIKVPVSLDVRKKLLLFDSNILVLNRGYKVGENENLKTRVTLIPMGDKERLDVLLDYSIKDSSGKVVITQSETVMIEDRVNFRKNFDINGLALGKYTINLKLTYPNGIATSSAQFEIVPETPTSLLKDVIYYIIVLIFIVSIVLIFVIFRSRLNEQR